MSNSPTNVDDLGLTEKGNANAGGCGCGGCGCGGQAETDTTATDQTSTAQVGGDDANADEAVVTRQHYAVTGMTCGHCVSSVTEELSEVDGVDSVSVDLNPGGESTVMVVSSKPVPEDAIRAAVTEAGYSLASA